MSSKRKASASSADKTNKKSDNDNLISLVKASYGIPDPEITQRLYDINIINVLTKIKDKTLMIHFLNHFNETIWSTKIMKYIIHNKIHSDMNLFIYFIDKFIKNFVFRKDADHLIEFYINDTNFYSLKDNDENDYEICLDYFIKGIKKMNISHLKKLFNIGMNFSLLEKIKIYDNDFNDKKCEAVQDIKRIYFNQIAYFNKKLWKSPVVIKKAIECNFFILQHFCINEVSCKIIKEQCNYSDKISFFQHLRQYYPTAIPGQKEYMEYFEDHDEPLDKDIVIDTVHALCDPVLRKTDEGRRFENFYELIPL